MRALLRLTVGSPAACVITAGALAIILFMAAGYGGPLLVAAFIAAAWLLAFWGLFFLAMAVRHLADVLDLGRKEAVHADQ